MIWRRGGKNTIHSPPFLWRGEKGRNSKKYIYITRNGGKYLIENKYFEYNIFLGDFFSESKKGSGGRITSLTLEKKGDGEEGGRRGWLRDATGNAAAPTAAGSGGLTARAWRTGGRRSRESVRGGRCRRLLSSLRQEQLQAAAGSSGHGGGGGGGSSLQTPGSGSSTAPHTPGTWEPSNRFRPSGPPPPSTAPARPPSRPSSLLCACSGSVRALPPIRSPVSGCAAGSSSLPSFLCHSARTAAAAAAQARIRPGQELLCVRSAVCAAA